MNALVNLFALGVTAAVVAGAVIAFGVTEAARPLHPTYPVHYIEVVDAEYRIVGQRTFERDQREGDCSSVEVKVYPSERVVNWICNL